MLFASTLQTGGGPLWYTSIVIKYSIPFATWYVKDCQRGEKIKNKMNMNIICYKNKLKPFAVRKAIDTLELYRRTYFEQQRLRHL